MCLRAAPSENQADNAEHDQQPDQENDRQYPQEYFHFYLLPIVVTEIHAGKAKDAAALPA
jgi:hypothetical protein